MRLLWGMVSFFWNPTQNLESAEKMPLENMNVHQRVCNRNANPLYVLSWSFQQANDVKEIASWWSWPTHVHQEMACQLHYIQSRNSETPDPNTGRSNQGVPQGGVLSSLLLNIYFRGPNPPGVNQIYHADKSSATLLTLRTREVLDIVMW